MGCRPLRWSLARSETARPHFSVGPRALAACSRAAANIACSRRRFVYIFICQSNYLIRLARSIVFGVVIDLFEKRKDCFTSLPDLILFLLLFIAHKRHREASESSLKIDTQSRIYLQAQRLNQLRISARSAARTCEGSRYLRHTVPRPVA